MRECLSPFPVVHGGEYVIHSSSNEIQAHVRFKVSISSRMKQTLDTGQAYWVRACPESMH